MPCFLTHVSVFLSAGNVIGREKLLHRETDAAEESAGIVVGRADALAFGEAVVIHRDHQLGVPFQPDQGELPQRGVPETVGVRKKQNFLLLICAA